MPTKLKKKKKKSHFLGKQTEKSTGKSKYLLLPRREGSELPRGLGDRFLLAAGDLLLALDWRAKENVVFFVGIHFYG